MPTSCQQEDGKAVPRHLLLRGTRVIGPSAPTAKNELTTKACSGRHSFRGIWCGIHVPVHSVSRDSTLGLVSAAWSDLYTHYR